jgi:hypothetical protein
VSQESRREQKRSRALLATLWPSRQVTPVVLMKL